MARHKKQKGRLYKWRAEVRRRKRLWFMSPAEAQLVRIVGGKVITIDLLREPRNGFPLTFVWTMGELFKRERMRREVRVGGLYADFANDIGRVIECDSIRWHSDVLTEQRRDDYFWEHGQHIVLHLSGYELFNPKMHVHTAVKVKRFLEK